MGRKKRETKLIQCGIERRQTYMKRIRGLIKKAYELSVICDTDIALISFSPSGQLAHFSNKPEPWPKTVLQHFCQNIIPNMPDGKRAELQLSQDIFNLINAIAGEDDANDQPCTEAEEKGIFNLINTIAGEDDANDQPGTEAEEKETMREIRRHEFKLSLLKEKVNMFFPGTFDSVQEWERYQQFIDYALVEVVRRRQQIMSQSQLGFFIPRTNPSLSTQIPIQHRKAGKEAGMWGPTQGGMQVQMQGVPFFGKGDLSLSSQQIGSGQVYWSPCTNPSSGMQSTHCHILLQQQQDGTESGMRDPQRAHSHKPMQQQQAGTEPGMRDPQSAQWLKQKQQQQAGTETGMWDTLHGREQVQITCGELMQELLFSGMGYLSSPSTSAQTSVPSLVKSEVTAPFGASDYMWGPLIGHEMPFSGDEQPSGRSNTQLSRPLADEYHPTQTI